MSHKKDQTEKNVISDESVHEGRREALQKMIKGSGIAAGAGAVSSLQWAKPAIDSVVLPAHAIPSNPCGLGYAPYYYSGYYYYCYPVGF